MTVLLLKSDPMMWALGKFGLSVFRRSPSTQWTFKATASVPGTTRSSKKGLLTRIATLPYQACLNLSRGKETRPSRSFRGSFIAQSLTLSASVAVDCTRRMCGEWGAGSKAKENKLGTWFFPAAEKPSGHETYPLSNQSGRLGLFQECSLGCKQVF